MCEASIPSSGAERLRAVVLEATCRTVIVFPLDIRLRGAICMRRRTADKNANTNKGCLRKVYPAFGSLFRAVFGRMLNSRVYVDADCRLISADCERPALKTAEVCNDCWPTMSSSSSNGPNMGHRHSLTIESTNPLHLLPSNSAIIHRRFSTTGDHAPLTNVKAIFERLPTHLRKEIFNNEKTRSEVLRTHLEMNKTSQDQEEEEEEEKKSEDSASRAESTS
uniref:Uncharacterized protein n=1 Tax=Steinernema glaseri TaxID=37863 RepID=A0A1I7YQX7_9BILA